jgi:hypothetical protein
MGQLEGRTGPLEEADRDDVGQRAAGMPVDGLCHETTILRLGVAGRDQWPCFTASR